MTFEKINDINCNLNFVAMVYQECFQTENNNLLIFDIDQMEFVQKYCVNPNNENMNEMLQDDIGFNSFQIVRSSELIDNSWQTNNMTTEKVQ